MSQSLSCLIVCTEFPPGPGGIGSHAFFLAKGLADRGWLVHVVTPQDYVDAHELAAFNRAQAFTITSLPGGARSFGRLVRRMRTLMGAARSAHPDVVIASGSWALWVGGVLARVLGLSLVVIGHGSEFLESSRVRQMFTGLATRSARRVVAVSAYTAALIEDVGVSPMSITVIHNGADSHRFRLDLDTTTLRTRLGLDGRRVVLTVGQVSERKAQDIVVRSFPRVLSQCPDVVYLVVGLPTRGAEIQALARELGVEDAIRLLGAVADADIPLYYGLCDLFVLVSRQTTEGDVEGFGIVAREAALCGKPAVVSGGSGLEEAVLHGETGLVVPQESPDDTAAAIVRLLEDDALRGRMASAARSLALGATWERQLDRYNTLLRSVLSAP